MPTDDLKEDEEGKERGGRWAVSIPESLPQRHFTMTQTIFFFSLSGYFLSPIINFLLGYRKLLLIAILFRDLKPPYVGSYKTKSFIPRQTFGIQELHKWKDKDKKQESRNVIQIPYKNSDNWNSYFTSGSLLMWFLWQYIPFQIYTL